MRIVRYEGVLKRAVLECGVVPLTEPRFHVMARVKARQAHR